VAVPRATETIGSGVPLGLGCTSRRSVWAAVRASTSGSVAAPSGSATGAVAEGSAGSVSGSE